MGMEEEGLHLPPPPYRPPPPPPPAFAHLSVEGFSARLTVIVEPVQTGPMTTWRYLEDGLAIVYEWSSRKRHTQCSQVWSSAIARYPPLNSFPLNHCTAEAAEKGS